MASNIPDQSNPPPPAAVSPILISSAGVRSLVTHKSLISHLKSTLPQFSAAVQSPLRHAHQTSPSSSLLLMPSWSTSPSLPYIGTKLVTHHPNNTTLPGVHAVYVLFSALTGQPLAAMDATELTLYRTACISALASLYLSREDSETLVMIGSGALAPHLIRAHLTVRSKIRKVVIWNRTMEKAKALADHLSGEEELKFVRFESNGDLEGAVRGGDIITCATNSQVALVKGEDLKKGAHLNMVGSFRAGMRECDDEAVRRGRVYVDGEAAAAEAGELVGAFERGVMRKEDVVGDLVELVEGEKIGRRNVEEITVFKSVGSATVDLLSAQMVYERGGRACKGAISRSNPSLRVP
ncbi:protein SAR DEFICIENT 4 [Andrographis paniculata]|uniref:protein SAR DEFICIENT 4 n=1 Tax=Andrographis paniculata TaxID=175694 RepID=UPI0021E9844E|nr:protein SAR DEFICIENT 4 [Andrographis paniculata]